MKKRFTFSLIMGKRLFLRPKDKLFWIGFVSLLIYFHLLNCCRVIICPGFLLRVLSFHFYSTCLCKRVNFQSNLFKKIQLLNIKMSDKLLWIHYGFPQNKALAMALELQWHFGKIGLRLLCNMLGRLYTSQRHLAKGTKRPKASMLCLLSHVPWHEAASTWKESLLLTHTKALYGLVATLFSLAANTEYGNSTGEDLLWGVQREASVSTSKMGELERWKKERHHSQTDTAICLCTKHSELLLEVN